MAVQTISYANKSAINTNPEIADTNKVNDTDMNEIKSVVNNNATELTKRQGTILWTNPNHTSNFAQSTITLSSSDYDYLIFFFKLGTTSNLQVSQLCLKGWGCRAFTHNTDGSLRYRNIIRNSDTSFTISDGLLPDGSSANGAIIPMYCLGIRCGDIS